MNIRFALAALTAASLGAPAEALGQLGTRRLLEVNPPRSAKPGQQVTLSVRGAAVRARYRFVATLTETGFGGPARHTDPSCPTNVTLGSGAQVTWLPKSGVYRLTAYGPVGPAETDTLSLTYRVPPRAVMLATSQTPAQPSGVTLVLRTDDLGPGHVYEWWMEYAYSTGNGPAQQGIAWSQPWTTRTTSHLAAYPTPIPSSAPIKARVSIYGGDPCAILAAGSIPATQ